VYYVGPSTCFLIDGLSYVAVIASLLMMRVTPHQHRPRTRSVLHELHEGVAYAWGSVPIRVMLLLMALLSLTGMPAYNILSPIFAAALGGGMEEGSRTLGFLQGASGVGALVGAVALASRRSVVGLGRLIAIAGVVFGFAIIAFATSRHLWLSLLIAPIVGFSMLSVFASANTLLQTLADDDKRGRVMSLFTMAFMGMAPFGNLLAGAAATHLGGGIAGAGRTVMLGGVIAVVATLFFAATLPFIRKIVRPIYVQKGILSEVATGLGNAAGASTSQGEVVDGGVELTPEDGEPA
jgi:MFS family permease